MENNSDPDQSDPSLYRRGIWNTRSGRYVQRQGTKYFVFADGDNYSNVITYDDGVQYGVNFDPDKNQSYINQNENRIYFTGGRTKRKRSKRKRSRKYKK